MTKPPAYALHPIRTEADYQAALRTVTPYFDHEPEVDSDAGAHLLTMAMVWKLHTGLGIPAESLIRPTV
jgi:antitoxin component HigA of HigAB toxin-antitoxin module